MRDLVRYTTYQGPNNSAELLKDDNDPRRQEYLAQFADREGTTFLLKFWKKYRNKDTQARLDTFLDGMHPTAIRLAAVHRYLLPNASQASFNNFIRSHLSRVKSPEKLTDERLDKLYQNYGPGAIGSSGDRPAALAELVGIILNDGVREPTLRIDSLRFAADTPYETRLVNDPNRGKRAMPSEVATALRGALSQVVDAGTARRVSGSFKLADGTPLAMGGKTGTGDNRIEAIGAGGRILSSKAINRTATFVFYIGDHHFGALTAFVPGASAQAFKFTSALPVQVLKGMAPILTPYLQPASHTLCMAQ
jgi:membrane peptidoglycan carboxypeptidase